MFAESRSIEMMKSKHSLILAFAAASTAFAVGCTNDKPDMHKEPNVELIQDMMDQPALKAQDYEPNDPMKGSSRLPPEHTVPVGFKPYPYHQDPVAAAKNLKNPLAGEMSPQVLNLGRTKFETYCAVCHGYEGKGDGPVSVKMALKPPPLISEKIINLADGGIFHIISDGQGVMSSYAYQLVEEKDRWAIVNYVRSLQKLSRGGSSSGMTQSPSDDPTTEKSKKHKKKKKKHGK
jgi:mono/diheme cytochrome c family protein